MKQEDGCDGVQDGVMSETTPIGSISTRSRVPTDAPKVASGSGDGGSVTGSISSSDGEDNTAESISADLKTSPNTSGSSLGGISSSSPCSVTEEVINGKPECKMEQSIGSCDESVSECNPRDSLSSSSVSSTPTGVNDKNTRNSDGVDMDHSPPPAIVTNWDESQAAPDHEFMPESSPRDSLSSTSPSSSLSGATNRTVRNSDSSDMDQSPPKPLSGIAPNSDGRQADGIGVSQVNSQSKLDSFSGKNIAVQNARSTSTSKTKMTLRSGRVSLPESFPPEQLRETNKQKRSKYRSKQKSLGRPVKRRLSVDDQSPYSSEVNPAKLYRRESSDTSSNISSCSHEAEDSTSVVGAQSGDITSGSPVLPKVYTTNTNAEDSTSENERLSGDEKFATDSTEVAPDNELHFLDVEEVPDQTSVEKKENSESSVYQPTTSAMESGSLPHTAIGGEKDIRMVAEMPAPCVQSDSDSDLCMETQASGPESQASGPESRASRDPASSSVEGEFSASNCIDPMNDKLLEDTCGGIQEYSQDEGNNATPTSSDLGQVSQDGRQTSCQSAPTGGIDNTHSANNFETNVTLDAEEGRTHEIPPADHSGQQEPAVAPDSSTEEIKEEITSNGATKVQYQMSAIISQPSATDVTTGEPTKCPSDTEDKTGEKAPQDAGVVESPEENSSSFSHSPEEQFCQRDLQIYRYITTNGSPDGRYAPYITRRRPLRSGNPTQRAMGSLRGANGGDGENYRRVFTCVRRHEARQTGDGGHETTSAALPSLGDNCSIS